jgi:hypothetical protein
LPNRRELANTIIIPEMQRKLGEKEKPVKDRLERFRLSALYRERYPGGMVHALQTYLSDFSPLLPQGISQKSPFSKGDLMTGSSFAKGGISSFIRAESSPNSSKPTLLFDNIRGLEECQAAVETFPASRFIFFDAPAMVRLKRLIKRNDSFDQVSASAVNQTLLKELEAIEGLEQVFQKPALLKLAATGTPAEKMLDAVKIIVAENQNYHAEAARAFLQQSLDDSRLLYLDTSQKDLEAVTRLIKEWV